MLKIHAWITRKRKIDPDLSKLVLGYLSFKVGLILVGAFASQILAFNWPLAKANGWTPPPGIPSWFAGFSSWDAGVYTQIADHGYSNEVMKWPFFPLYPLLIRIFKPIFFGNSLFSAFLVSNVCSLFVVVYLYRLTRLFWSKESASNAVILLLAFPTSFFLTAAYSESLFLALVLAAFYYFYSDKLWTSALITFFVPLSRPQGLMFIVPLLVLAGQKIYLGSRSGSSSFLRQEWRLAIPGIFALLGTSGYFLFAKLTFGRPFAGLDAEKYFISQNSLSNLLHPAVWFRQNFVDINLKLYDYTHGIFDRIEFVLAVAAFIWIIETQPLALKVYAGLYILVQGMSGNLMAYTRMVLMAFPIFMMLGNFRWSRLLIPMMAALQLLFFIMYIRMYWVA